MSAGGGAPSTSRRLIEPSSAAQSMSSEASSDASSNHDGERDDRSDPGGDPGGALFGSDAEMGCCPVPGSH